jgi:hypothetical protein
MIESMNGGAFLSLTGEEAYRTLDQLSDNSQQWDFSSCRDRAARIQKKGGIYEVKEDIELKMKIDALTKKVEALVVNKSMNIFKNYSSSFLRYKVTDQIFHVQVLLIHHSQ